MPVKRLKQFLDSHGVKYVTIRHSQAFTAQEIAASAHVSGKELAKTVMADVDGRMVMVVLPASHRVVLEFLATATNAKDVRLASERQFRDRFSDCDIGAMPPFGNLYGMDVFVSESLTEDEEIVFNAGSHTELIRMPYRDFERLVRPKVVRLAYADAVDA
ncbi:MAG: YbaK/EbsC family protein [Candidatus Nealsonbacteria bacterium]|nr:YbaK/EbsC family protein [Candidatus Nealsonbacteria bacterium]